MLRWIGLRRASYLAGALGIAIAMPGFCQTPSASSEVRQQVSPAETQPSVVETQWNLIELNGSEVNVPEGEGQAYIYLQQEGYKLSGSDGCNRLFGSYDLSGNSLQFHSVAQTRMACRGVLMERGSEFIEALKLTTSFQMSSDILQLKVDDRVLARFQARKK